MAPDVPEVNSPFRHPLLKAVGCPSSGNGTQVFLRHLRRGLEYCRDYGLFASANDWLALLSEQEKEVNRYRCLASPTGAELNNQPWGKLHACITASQEVRNRSTGDADALFALMVIQCATNQQRLTNYALDGLKACYRSMGRLGDTNDRWTLVTSSSLMNAEAIEKVLERAQDSNVRQFCNMVLVRLKSTMPPTASLDKRTDIAAVQELNDAKEKAEPVADNFKARNLNEDSDQEDHCTEGEKDTEGQNRRPFTRGDSIMAWHRRQANFSNRSDRLGLDTWTTLPVEETSRIASELPALLSDSRSPHHQAAILAVACLITSTPPHVLLHASMRPGKDLFVDLSEGCFSWPVEALYGASEEGSSHKGESIRIPFFQPLKTALDCLAESTGRSSHDHFSDLFGIRPETPAWESLIKQMRDFLALKTDRAIKATPGRWSASISRIYLQISQSDLISAVCAIDLKLTPQAALYYFHPAESDLLPVIKKVYLQLGFGDPVSLRGAGMRSSIASSETISTGFSRLLEDIRTLGEALMKPGQTPIDLIEAFNEMTLLVAAMVIFTIGGRGSLVEKITMGSLFCSDDSWWLKDKLVAFENGARILPKPRVLQEILFIWHQTRIQVGKRLCDDIDKKHAHQLQCWKEMASGLLRFDAKAFVLIRKDGMKACQSVNASDIEWVARKYFGQGKNFMRHVLVTHWGVEGKDRYLLRLITGHATEKLAVPAGGAVYSPQSAVRHAGFILERLLEQWIPAANQVRKGVAYRFAGLPGKSILKVYKAYRQHLSHWDAPLLSQWHLAAERIVDRLRALLLQGRGPADPCASLWLHLAAFDGLHEANDIADIVTHTRERLFRGSCTWVASLQRKELDPPVVLGLQEPTALFLSSLENFTGICTENIHSTEVTVSNWLYIHMPDCWRRSKKEGNDSASAARGLLACVALWADWTLPVAVQMGYSSDNHCPVLDSWSNASLYKLPVEASISSEIARKPQPANSEGWLKALYKQINLLGSTRHKLGEEKKRARLYQTWSESVGLASCDTLASLIAQAISLNATKVEQMQKERIQFSSLATYMSALNPFFFEHEHLIPESFDNLDWEQFSTDLKGYGMAPDRSETTASEAARWFLIAWQELGYPVTDSYQTDRNRGRAKTRRPQAIAILSSELSDAARQSMTSTTLSPLEKTRAQAALELLMNCPLRWSELSRLSVYSCLGSNWLCIKPEGFSHLKSTNAKRRLRLDMKSSEILRDLIAQISDRNRFNRSDERLLFGSKPDAAGAKVEDSAWIHECITSSIKASSGNSNFRIHALRAHAISSLISKDWCQALGGWIQGDLGPKKAAHFVEYRHENAWATDEARLKAGHAAISTTLSYYYHAWAPVRQLALHSSLSGHSPTFHLLALAKTSKDGMRKAMERHPDWRDDCWLYLMRKRRTLFSPLARGFTNPKEAAVSQDFVSSQISPLVSIRVKSASSTYCSDVIYVGLRLIGLSKVQAGNLIRLSDVRIQDGIENLLSDAHVDSSKLRGRIRGEQDGRALNADVALLTSDSARTMIDCLSALPASLLTAFGKILVPRHGLLNWDEVLMTIAPYLENSSVKLEVVTDRACVDLEVSRVLSQHPVIKMAPPAYDVGAIPRIFVLPRSDSQGNRVLKARWTTLTRILCSAMSVLNNAEPRYSSTKGLPS